MGTLNIEEQLANIASELQAQERRQSAIAKQCDYLTALNSRIMGQEHIKQRMATHMLLMHARAYNGIASKKRNILFVGPSGCGKTLTAETMISSVGLPHASLNLGDVTAAGFVGEDLINAFSMYARSVAFQEKARLRNDALDDFNAFMLNRQKEKGVIFFDELDKTAPRNDLTNHGYGKRVQIELMKYIQGSLTRAYTSGVNEDRKQSMSPHVVLDTTDMNFVIAGAFIGLDDIIKKRAGLKNPTRAELTAAFTKQDLVQYGIMPELVGRIHQVFLFEELDEESLYRILTSNTSPLASNAVEFKEVFGANLRYYRDAMRYVAHLCYEHKEFGARVGESFCDEICDTIMDDIRNRLHGNDVYITLDLAQKVLGKYERRDADTDMGFKPARPVVLRPEDERRKRLWPNHPQQ